MSSVTDATSARRLQDKTAVIFGAAGEVGSEVATELAAQGVRVFLSSRTKTRVQELAQAISSHGETATAAEVDALDDDAVNRYLDDLAAAARRIDILFNAMGPQAVEYRNATSTLELAAETFMLPMTTIVRSQFITARAAPGTSSQRGRASSSSSRHRHPARSRRPQHRRWAAPQLASLYSRPASEPRQSGRRPPSWGQGSGVVAIRPFGAVMTR
jgi:NAD(P)-dependent dehydrogenase (short-subunit alcohol dehydrogenase family)